MDRPSSSEKKKGSLILEESQMVSLPLPAKLMSDAMKGLSKNLTNQSQSLVDTPLRADALEFDLSAGFQSILSEAGSSGLSVKQKSPRKRKASMLKKSPASAMVSEGEEALIHILNQATREGKVSGIQFNGSGPTINHLLFADDTLLVCKANKEDCEEMMQCLSKYGHISGQLINLDKSSITFGAKVEEGTKQWIKNRSGIQLEGGSGKYLGLPECLSGSKQVLFGFIKEKLHSRLTGWYAKTLSQGGKEVLLKSIALAFPVYAMTCFKLPKSLCTKLTGVMMDFWWSTMQNIRKIHWIGAQKLMLPKVLGGFGFKDLQCFNQALLAKQAWRLLHDSDSLFSQLFKSRYFLNSDFLNAPKGTRPSYAWQSILFGRDLLKAGLKRVIGNGEQTSVWIDKWLFDGLSRRPMNTQEFIDIKLKVCHIIDPLSRNWNLNMLRDLFPWKDIQIILQQRPLLSRDDSYCWSGTTNGLYTVKSGYDFCCRQAHHQLFREAESPCNGFGDSIYSNMAHVLQTAKLSGSFLHLSFVRPWILWVLWKNRNKLLFEGTSCLTQNIVDKAAEDCKQWLLAQKKGFQSADSEAKRWTPPQADEIKCNIGFAWSRQKQLAGASWVVRDATGTVLLHSRRSYSQVHSLFQAKVKSWEWALASMDQHHFDKVTFGASSHEIIKALHKPKDWPVWTGHIVELLHLTKNRPNWFMMMEPRQCNNGAFEIAKSVITGMRWQSYVSRSFPCWLRNLFDEERELWDELQCLALGRDDPAIVIPRGVYAVARVHGRVLDASCVQFLFQSEADLIGIQRREPLIFNNWLVATQRWVDFPPVDFLTTIDLWVQIRGIPLPYVCVGTITMVAERLGEIILVEFQEATTTQIAFVRVRIRFGITDSLRFTHHRNYCPFLQPLPVTRNDGGDVLVAGRERVILRDELHRSDMNSQSQNSDVSFPYPRSPPPRVATPPPNAAEFADAFPYFHQSREAFSPTATGLTPLNASLSQQDFTGSNNHQSNLGQFSRASRNFEVGESSKQGEVGDCSTRGELGDPFKRKFFVGSKKEPDRRNQKQKYQEPNMGGILKPPKKR
ncbi:unnamed protein product [Arabidopsis halleri]